MASAKMAALLLAAMMAATVGAQTVPTGCTYNLGVFTCDYGTALPLNANGFSPEPQRLIIENVHGTFTAAQFTNFATGVDTTTFDINYAAELTISCVSGGTGVLTLSADSFTGMQVYDDIRIIDCQFTAIAANAFQHFGAVNLMRFQGGNMDSIDPDAFVGLNVIRKNKVSVPMGNFELVDVDLIPGGLPAGVFSNMTEAEGITISNSRLFTVDLSLFSTATKVRRINLDHNGFTFLPDNLFTSVAALGEVSMAGIAWECTCNNLWFMDHFNAKEVLLTSPVSCTLPSQYYGKSAHTYYSELCDKTLDCDGGKMMAVDLGGVACLTILQIVIYVFAFISFVFTIAALIITQKNKSAIKDGGAGGGGAGGKKPPGGPPGRGGAGGRRPPPRKR